MPLLHWLSREEDIHAATQTPYRLLEQVAAHSHGDLDTGNMLIQGDNLAALKALLPYYAGKVKCIFIDPPYNTRSAFEHYDDNLEHTEWLAMMYPRLELLRQLLAEDGSIWVTIDDNEAHYLKVIMDELFGRLNFVANVIWEKKSAPQSNATWLSDSHDHILAFAKNKQVWRPNKLTRTALQDSIYKNSDEFDGINDDGKWYGRGPWYADNFTLSLKSGQRGKQFAKTGESVNIYEIVTPSGRKTMPPQGRAWSHTPASFQVLLEQHRIWFGKDGSNKPTIKRFLSELQSKGVVPTTVWNYQDVGENRIAAQELNKLMGEQGFSTPKPEALMRRILTIASNPDDLVLDSFLGSGTTAAVAHKMKRRYIGIEMGEHATTHCVPRIQKVIEGEQGGISEAAGWNGGGGFRFYKLGAPVFDENGLLSPDIRFAPLAAHLWFVSTGIPYKGRANSPFLGTHEDVGYYLLYNGILGDKSVSGGNVLTARILTSLPKHAGAKVIFGESCRLSAERLRAEGITFRQIPYEIKAR